MPDVVQISEDMAYKAHSMISPAMARRFLVPCYRRWVQAIRGAGCPIVNMDSDGYIADLIPLWIEAGINCCNPIDVAAGNDIVEYRQRFGRQMAYVGGIDKRAMAAGGEALRAEVMRVAPLITEGGYIPTCDHGVPAEVPYEDRIYYRRRCVELGGSAPQLYPFSPLSETPSIIYFCPIRKTMKVGTKPSTAPAISTPTGLLPVRVTVVRPTVRVRISCRVVTMSG